MRRTQSKPHSFVDRNEDQKKLVEGEIVRAESGHARDQEKKLRQLDVAAHISGWLSSPGLQAPR
jgi:hypothetical protein